MGFARRRAGTAGPRTSVPLAFLDGYASARRTNVGTPASTRITH